VFSHNYSSANNRRCDTAAAADSRQWWRCSPMHVCLLTYSQQAPLLTWGPVGQRAWSQLRQRATPTYTTTVNSCSNKWPSLWLWHWLSEKTTKLLLHPFNGLFSRTTWVSWYQKSKTSLDLNEARDNGVWDAVASAGPHANNLHLAPDR